MIHRLFMILLSLGIAGAASAESGDRDDVLARMIAAYGGEEQLRKLDRMIQEWDMLALRTNSPADDRRSIDFGGRLRVELTYPDKRETRILNGDVGIAVFRDKPPAIASTTQRDAMRLQLMRLYSPLALQERTDAIGVSSDDGYVVLTLREHGLLTEYYVNADSWTIEKTIGTLNAGGMAMQFVAEYSEYALVDGVLMYHRENKFAGGTNTAVLKLRNVEFDVDFADDVFEVPDIPEPSVTAMLRAPAGDIVAICSGECRNSTMGP
jgi:hypothetical protein